MSEKIIEINQEFVTTIKGVPFAGVQISTNKQIIQLLQVDLLQIALFMPILQIT